MENSHSGCGCLLAGLLLIPLIVVELVIASTLFGSNRYFWPTLATVIAGAGVIVGLALTLWFRRR